jgi:hypothetical protein
LYVTTLAYVIQREYLINIKQNCKEVVSFNMPIINVTHLGSLSFIIKMPIV